MNPNAENTNTNTDISKTNNNLLENATTMDFDQLFNQDDKEVDKQIKYTQSKKGKKVQLLARINNIQMLQTKAEINYRKSLVDPTKDSVDLAIEMKSLAGELQIAESVFAQLFPQEALAMTSDKKSS